MLLDVREPHEVAFAALPGAVLIPLGELPERIGELDPDGARSSCTATTACGRRARSTILRVARVHALRATSPAASTRGRVTVDPSLPRY